MPNINEIQQTLDIRKADAENLSPPAGFQTRTLSRSLSQMQEFQQPLAELEQSHANIATLAEYQASCESELWVYTHTIQAIAVCKNTTAYIFLPQ